MSEQGNRPENSRKNKSHLELSYTDLLLFLIRILAKQNKGKNGKKCQLNNAFGMDMNIHIR